MKVYIASDHTGFEFKKRLKTELLALGYDPEDMGPFEFDMNDDYPDFVSLAAKAVAANADARGIIFGGSGQGEAMSANRVKGARAAVFYGPRRAVKEVDATGRESSDPLEIVRLAREHNDANILSIARRFVSEEEAMEAIKLFLHTDFSGAERHARRIAKLDQ